MPTYVAPNPSDYQILNPKYETNKVEPDEIEQQYKRYAIKLVSISKV